MDVSLHGSIAVQYGCIVQLCIALNLYLLIFTAVLLYCSVVCYGCIFVVVVNLLIGHLLIKIWTSAHQISDICYPFKKVKVCLLGHDGVIKVHKTATMLRQKSTQVFSQDMDWILGV